MEAVTGQNVADAVRTWVLEPLGMRGTLEGASLDPETVMPITRVLTRHRVPDLRITPLGKKPLGPPDPLRHYGHTAGALYTDAKSLSSLLEMLSSGGMHEGNRFLSEKAISEMTREHAVYGQISPTLSYGLGLLIIKDPKLSSGRILGHQGFAYGCADGAFWEEGTSRQVVFLNGGCSEARSGRLGVANRDVLRWALRKELPAWK
ncbi:MAG: serine hydrolase [Clostridia bacterium]|nr:serine hydrolase [Clostridia bacterium]